MKNKEVRTEEKGFGMAERHQDLQDKILAQVRVSRHGLEEGFEDIQG